MGIVSPSRKQGRRDDAEAPPSHRFRGGLPEVEMAGPYVTVAEFKVFTDKLQAVMNTMTIEGNQHADQGLAQAQTRLDRLETFEG